MATITDRSGTRHEVPEGVIASRNTDRFTKCGSCRATADVLLTSTTETITCQYPEGTDDFVKPMRVSACSRHVKINLKRAAAMRSIVKVYDPETGRLVVQN